MKNDSTEKITKKNRIKCSMLIPILLALILAAETYAWFFNKMDMATLMQVTPPSDITILGPGGSDMTSLDLSYTDADKVGNQVTIKRVICIQNAADAHRLEIVHTTNLKGLTFKLYPATDVTNEENIGSDVPTVTENRYTYKYDKDKPLLGSYLNVRNEETAEYKYAKDDYHSKNYPNYRSDDVQSHAEPVYWLIDEKLEDDTQNDETITENGVPQKYHRTYYVCEISWTETTKETDIFYILAETATRD